jgi:hypothetical protein
MYHPPVPAVPAPGMAGPPLRPGAFFNYMGMGHLPKSALSHLQSSATANYMAGLSGSTAGSLAQPAQFSPAPFPEPEPTIQEPPLQYRGTNNQQFSPAPAPAPAPAVAEAQSCVHQVPLPRGQQQGL